MISVSEKFRTKIKLNDMPAYRIAQLAGLDPSTLSKLLCGIANIQENDLRVIRVGEVLGLTKEECFENRAHRLKSD
jgi:hypothetical protein